MQWRKPAEPARKWHVLTELDNVVFSEEKVLELEVAVSDAFAVDVADCLARLARPRGDLREWHRALCPIALEPVKEVTIWAELHHDAQLVDGGRERRHRCVPVQPRVHVGHNVRVHVQSDQALGLLEGL